MNAYRDGRGLLASTLTKESARESPVPEPILARMRRPERWMGRSRGTKPSLAPTKTNEAGMSPYRPMEPGRSRPHRKYGAPRFGAAPGRHLERFDSGQERWSAWENPARFAPFIMPLEASARGQ